MTDSVEPVDLSALRFYKPVAAAFPQAGSTTQYAKRLRTIFSPHFFVETGEGYGTNCCQPESDFACRDFCAVDARAEPYGNLFLNVGCYPAYKIQPQTWPEIQYTLLLLYRKGR